MAAKARQDLDIATHTEVQKDTRGLICFKCWRFTILLSTEDSRSVIDIA